MRRRQHRGRRRCRGFVECDRRGGGWRCQRESRQGFVACAFQYRHRLGLFDGNRQDREGGRSAEGIRDACDLVRGRKHDDDASAVRRLKILDGCRDVRMAVRLQQQHACTQRPDEFAGGVERVGLPNRRFAVQGLSDLFEQSIVAGQRDDFDAQRVRSTRLVSERGRRLRMCIHVHGFCRQRNAPVLMPSYCAWFDGDPTAKCR